MEKVFDWWEEVLQWISQASPQGDPPGVVFWDLSNHRSRATSGGQARESLRRQLLLKKWLWGLRRPCRGSTTCGAPATMTSSIWSCNLGRHGLGKVRSAFTISCRGKFVGRWACWNNEVEEHPSTGNRLPQLVQKPCHNHLSLRAPCYSKPNPFVGTRYPSMN